MGSEDSASAPTEAAAWTGLSASAGVHSCCKARHSSQHSPTIANRRASQVAELAEVALPESSNPANAMSCCPLTSGAFVVSARQSVQDDRASEAVIHDALVPVLADLHSAPRALPLRLPNQNQTYLRCCVFLI